MVVLMGTETEPMMGTETETELVQIHVRVSRRLLAETDEARGDLSRAAYVRRSLTTHLEMEAEVRQAMERALTGAVE